MRFSYDDVKRVEEALASLPYPLKIKRTRKNEYKVYDVEGNELKLVSYNQIAVLLHFISKNRK